MRLLWLPDVLRAAGLTVHTYDGWETRGAESWGPIRGIVCHGTASSRSSTVAGDTRVLWVTGSESAPVPISQMYLSRSGEWTVGASGRCNHVRTGRGVHAGLGNSALIGIEAANDDKGEPWSPAQLDSYIVGVAALCRHLGLPASAVVGHREHQPGEKVDPYGVDMDEFRRRVAALLASPGSTVEDDTMRYLRFGISIYREVVGVDGRLTLYPVTEPEWLALKAAFGAPPAYTQMQTAAPDFTNAWVDGTLARPAAGGLPPHTHTVNVVTGPAVEA